MVRATVKMHNFWEFRVFTDRLACTAEKFAITVEVRPEAWISQECPNCGSATETTRHQDTLTCPCGFEGYANLTASEMFSDVINRTYHGQWHGSRAPSGTTIVVGVTTRSPS